MTKTFWIGTLSFAWILIIIGIRCCCPSLVLASNTLNTIVLVSLMVVPFVTCFCYLKTEGGFIKIIGAFFLIVSLMTGSLLYILAGHDLWDSISSNRRWMHTEITRCSVGNWNVIAYKSRLPDWLVIGSGMPAEAIQICAEKEIPPFFKIVQNIGSDDEIKNLPPSKELFKPIDSNHVKWRDKLILEVK